MRSASTVTVDRPVAGPVLGVDGVVLDGGVEPQPVALLAVVEGALERPRAGRGAGRARRGARGAGGAWLVVVVVVVVRLGVVLVVGFVLLVVGLGLGLEGRGHERVVLGAQVQLVDASPRAPRRRRRRRSAPARGRA